LITPKIQVLPVGLYHKGGTRAERGWGTEARSRKGDGLQQRVLVADREIAGGGREEHAMRFDAEKGPRKRSSCGGGVFQSEFVAEVKGALPKVNAKRDSGGKKGRGLEKGSISHLRANDTGVGGGEKGIGGQSATR